MATIPYPVLSYWRRIAKLVSVMSSFQIVPFESQAHRQQVIDLWRRVFGYDKAHNDPALAIAKKLAVTDGLFFVAVAGADVVGTIMAGYDGHRGWLYSLAVLPEHRRQGLGQALIAHAEQALAGRGCVKINLQIMPSNAAVQAFYESAGYVAEARISMGKTLPQILPPL